MEIRRFVDFGRVIDESPEASRSPVFTDFLDCFLVLGTPLEIRRFIFPYLPQIWNIFIGNMSVIGPRPALWNQDLLTAERDKWKANDIKPGLTGWAQINGRDELEIPVKARYDGEYAEAMNTGHGFRMDVKCFLGSLHVFGRDDSVIEGSTGELKKEKTK